MKKNRILPLLALLASGTLALADSSYDTNVPAAYHVPPPVVSYPYIGAAFGMTNVSDSTYVYDILPYTENSDIDYSAMMFQAGYQVNPYIAAEFRYWFSVSSGDYTTDSLDGVFDSFDAWGMYLKPMYPITPEFSVYGLLGFSGVTVTGGYGWDLLYNDGDFSWGGGLSYDVTPNIALFADYVQLFNSTLEFYDYSQDTKVDTFNFGITYKF